MYHNSVYELMVRFGTDRAKMMLARLGFTGDVSIRNKMLSGSIESAQKRVEGNNFDVRKQLLQYDDVINQQRTIIYDRRNEILDSESVHDRVIEAIKYHISDLVNSHFEPEGRITSNDVDKEELVSRSTEDVVDILTNKVIDTYEKKIKEVPKEIINEFEKAITLRVIDTNWMEHINTMSHLREGIHLRSYAQEDPLRAYTNEGFELFDALLNTIDTQTVIYLMKAEVRQNVERKEVAKGTAVEDNSKPKKTAPKRVQKIGRNDLCPCGSGKKYKQCHGK